MNKLYNFLKDPPDLLNVVLLSSHELLLTAGIIALTLYIFGYKKGKDIGLLCPAIYVVIQIILKAISRA